MISSKIWRCVRQEVVSKISRNSTTAGKILSMYLRQSHKV